MELEHWNKYYYINKVPFEPYEFSKYKSSYNVSNMKSDPLLIRLIFSKK